MDLLEQLAEATAELKSIRERSDEYMGNNPNKYRSPIKNAEATCHRLAMKCKIMGLIPKTERELLNERINAAFPKAKSKQIVEFEGAKYKNTYSPRELSNSRKTVKSWDQEWVKQ